MKLYFKEELYHLSDLRYTLLQTKVKKKNFARPIRSIKLKKNYIGKVVCEILCYKQTNFLLLLSKDNFLDLCKLHNKIQSAKKNLILIKREK